MKLTNGNERIYGVRVKNMDGTFSDFEFADLLGANRFAKMAKEDGTYWGIWERVQQFPKTTQRDGNNKWKS